MSGEPAGTRPELPRHRPVPAPSRRRAPHATRWATELLRSRWLAFCVLAAIVVGFAGAWAGGTLVQDGPGISLYVRLAVDHLTHDGRVGYWVPEIWSGTPVWALGPSFPVLLLVPLAKVFGATTAVKAGILGLQVAGAWGAYVLARSLWENTAAALVAGVVYGISPLMVVYAGLVGSQGAVGVIAAAPWLVWSLRRGLRGEGTRYLVAAALVAAFAVLHQAEYAYGLAIVCGFLLTIELARARSGTRSSRPRHVLARAAVVVVTALGVVAHWLVPFLALHGSFALSPPELVRQELIDGSASAVGREMGFFLNRSRGLSGVLTPDRPELLTDVHYLGWVPLAVTLFTALLIARRDDERTLSAVLVASVAVVWLSTGAMSLAAGGPVERGQVLPMLAVGAVAGLLLGGFIRRLSLGRTRLPVIAAVAAFLFLVPYVRPFLLLQRVSPFFSSIRFPRLYVVAALGLALGSAWPVARLSQRVGRHRPLAALATAGLAVAVGTAVLVDAWPYRSFYRLEGPSDAEAYRRAAPVVAQGGSGPRVATPVEPRPVNSLQRVGAQLSLGWPHPVAGKQVWRLTLEALLAPEGYMFRALGLSGSAYLAGERVANTGTPLALVSELELVPNPHSRPLVRAYDQALVVADRSITPELAVAMAHRNVGVVTGGQDADRALGGVAAPAGVGRSACRDVSLRALPPALAGEVASACGMHRWLPMMIRGRSPFGGNEAPGAVVAPLADGLRGMSVWLDDPSGRSELILRELAADGRTEARVVARARASGTDEYGMTSFTFDPIPDSASRRFVFEIECPGCLSELAPQLRAARTEDGTGNLLLGRRLQEDYLAAFAPLYERWPEAPPSRTTVNGRRTGPDRWRVESSATRPSLVVVAEANFPGWRARVDGRPAPVVEVDGAFLGVPVPEGSHVVTLDYRLPAAVWLGRVITALTVLTVLALAVRSRRRRRARASASLAGAAAQVPQGEGQPDQAAEAHHPADP